MEVIVTVKGEQNCHEITSDPKSISRVVDKLGQYLDNIHLEIPRFSLKMTLTRSNFIGMMNILMLSEHNLGLVQKSNEKIKYLEERNIKLVQSLVHHQKMVQDHKKSVRSVMNLGKPKSKQLA